MSYSLCRVLKPVVSRKVAVAAIASKHTSACISLPASLSSSHSSSQLSCLWSSQDVDNWPSPLTLLHSAGSVTLQLANLVEGNDSPLVEDKIQELVSEDAQCGNVDLACSMQSNCPEPYESRNKSPCHLNMPGGSAMAQHKHRSSELHEIFSNLRPTFA